MLLIDELLIRFLFILVPVAAIIATIVLIVRRQVRSLALTQTILTALVILCFLGSATMALWLHSMASADPLREHWQPRLNLIGMILCFGSFIPWIVFTVFHIAVAVKGKPAQPAR